MVTDALGFVYRSCSPDFFKLDVNEFLAPFLAVVRSEVTTGPITGVALSSIHKFLIYGLIGATCLPLRL